MSQYKLIDSRKAKAVKFLHKSLGELEKVLESIELVKESNQQELEDVREAKKNIEDMIEQKANANSMLTTQFDNIRTEMVEISKVIKNVR